MYKKQGKSRLLCPIPQDNFTIYKGLYAFENGPDYVGLEFIFSARIKKLALIQKKYVQLEDIFS